MSDSAVELVLVTGISGAGRSTAARAMEDQGWFVVDNLPPVLLPDAVQHISQTDSIRRLAVVVDVRSGHMFDDLARALEQVMRDGFEVRVVYLEASDNVLVRRFESSRRPHPLQGGGGILDGLTRERELLGDLRARADLVIDTSSLNVHDLRRKMDAAFGSEEDIPLRATVMSFGFKYGIPTDADLVADMRFLPNPHWNEELRPFTGEDAQVSDFVLAQAGAEEFIGQYVASLQTVIEGYLRENRKHATLAIGCTGGKHRSVATAIEIAKRLTSLTGIEVRVKHRDLGKE